MHVFLYPIIPLAYNQIKGTVAGDLFFIIEHFRETWYKLNM